MPNFKDFLKNEYRSEYDFMHKKLYSEPKIYTANNDLKKRWYVYFSFRNPNTNKLERQKPVYVSNKIKTKKARLKELEIYKSALTKLLERGYSPYDNKPFISDSEVMTTTKAIEFALKIKSNTLNSASFKKYSSRINQFTKYIERIGYDIRDIKEVNKKVINGFLNEILNNTSASNRNSSRRDLNSLFNILVENEVLAFNCIEHIKKIKTQVKKNKAYTPTEADMIYRHLAQHDPQLLLFIKFVSYNFLRPIEVCRLKIKDIDLENKILTFKAKNQPTKKKILVDLLIKDLPTIHNKNKDHYLFTPKGYPGEWSISEEDKRGYFTKRYAKVKNELGFNGDYGIYSFRHTFTTKVYRKLRESFTPEETESKLMLITGHATRSALRKYLREIDAERPDDYSDLLL